MKKALPVLVLCLLLCLSACGKKHAEPVGSGSAEPETAEKTSGKSSAKDGGQGSKDSAKETAAPAAQTAAPAAQTASPAAAPETQEKPDQNELPGQPAASPVGSWVDASGVIVMAVDGDFHVSILQTRADGTAAVWIFNGSYDETSGVLTYSDGMKQELTAAETETAYQNSRGTLTLKDGALIWADQHEQSVTFRRDES